MFPPITGKLQKIKINEKLTIFENFNVKKSKKSPLFSIPWHLSIMKAPDRPLRYWSSCNRFQKIGKMNKKLSFTEGVSVGFELILSIRNKTCPPEFLVELG